MASPEASNSLDRRGARHGDSDGLRPPSGWSRRSICHVPIVLSCPLSSALGANVASASLRCRPKLPEGVGRRSTRRIVGLRRCANYGVARRRLHPGCTRRESVAREESQLPAADRRDVLVPGGRLRQDIHGRRGSRRPWLVANSFSRRRYRPVTALQPRRRRTGQTRSCRT